MTKTVKKSLLLLLTLAFIVSSICIFASSKNAYATQTVEVNLTMEVGASVRSDGNGIRYGMYISDTEYGTINKKVADGEISNVVYGILIAPAFYHDAYALNEEENVFGESAAYYWEGSSVDKTGKVRITNLYTSNLGDHKDRDGYKVMFASIIDLKPENIDKEFIGVGYMKYTVGTTDKYIFAPINDNVRSMAYVAQTHIERNPGDPVNEALKSNYLDKVALVESYYTTEYYLENADGEFVKADAETVKVPSTIGAKVNPIQKEIAGYYFDSENVNNSGESTVYANDKTVLKAYYKSNSSINADGSFYNSDFSLTYNAADCSKPTGWTYTANDWGVYASGGNVRLTENGTIYSSKLFVKPGQYLYGSVFANDWNKKNSKLTLGIVFYDADGGVISTNNGSEISVSQSANCVEYATKAYIVPNDAAYVQLSIKGRNEAFVDSAKINTLDSLALETSNLNSDGSFFNSDFSLFVNPGAECDKPVGWAYTSGEWGVQASAGYVALVENGTVTSPKLAITAGTLVYGSVMAGDWNTKNNTKLNLGVVFYDANGNVLQTYNSGDIAVTNVGWLNCAEYKTTTYCAPENTAYVQLTIKGQNYAFIDSAKIIATDAYLISEDGTFYNYNFQLTETIAGMDSPKPLGWSYSSSAGYDVFATGSYLELRNGAYVESVLLNAAANTSISATVNAVDWDNTGDSKFMVGISFYNQDQDLISTSWSDEMQLTGAISDFNTAAVVAPEGTEYVRVAVKFVYGHNYIYSVKLNVIA